MRLEKSLERCTNLLHSPSTPKAHAPEEIIAMGGGRLALPSCLPTLCGDGQAMGSLVALPTVVRELLHLGPHWRARSS